MIICLKKWTNPRKQEAYWDQASDLGALVLLQSDVKIDTTETNTLRLKNLLTTEIRPMGFPVKLHILSRFHSKYFTRMLLKVTKIRWGNACTFLDRSGKYRRFYRKKNNKWLHKKTNLVAILLCSAKWAADPFWALVEQRAYGYLRKEELYLIKWYPEQQHQATFC